MEGFSGLMALGLVLHLVFGSIFVFGAVAGVFWLFRFATQEQLKKCFLIGVLVGGLGVLLSGIFLGEKADYSREGKGEYSEKNITDEAAAGEQK